MLTMTYVPSKSRFQEFAVTTDEKLKSLLTVDSFENWINTQDPNTIYDYTDNGKDYKPGCALVHYFRANGYPDVFVGTNGINPHYNNIKSKNRSDRYALPRELNEVVLGNYTYEGVKRSIKEYRDETKALTPCEV